MSKLILFYYKSELNFGGMETHFVMAKEYFSKDQEWNCEWLVLKSDNNIELQHISNGSKIKFEKSLELGRYIAQIYKDEACCMLFNDGRWIEELGTLRSTNPNAIMFQRSGGNEFMKAPLKKSNLPLIERQKLWGSYINEFLDAIISNSKFTTTRLKEIGVKQEKIVEIRGGVDIEECMKNLERWQVLREGFNKVHNLSNKKYLITVASRFVPFKDIHNVIEAIAECKYKEEIMLLLIGDGCEREGLLRLCEARLSNDSYCFLGKMQHTEAMKYICIADIFCNASKEFLKRSGQEYYVHTETMGRSLLEAIAQNTPVIATDVGGVREWFEENLHIGKLIEAENKTQMAQAIECILEQQYLKHKLYNESYTKYGWEYVFKKYKEIWEGYKHVKECSYNNI